MKRVVLALLAVLLLAPSLAWGDDSRHYEFRLAANGEATYHAAAGDTVTVSLTLCRTTGTGPMFAMQDEICFDPAFFAYQPDGTLLREGVKTTLVTLRENRLEPKRLQFVRHHPEASVSLVLVEARSGAKPGLTLQNDLILYTSSGEKTADYKRLYHEET